MGGPARRFPGRPSSAAPPRIEARAQPAWPTCAARLCAPPAGPLPARSPGRSGAPASPSLRHSGPLPSWRRPPPAGGALGPRSMVAETAGSCSGFSSRCSGPRSLAAPPQQEARVRTLENAGTEHKFLFRLFFLAGGEGGAGSPASPPWGVGNGWDVPTICIAHGTWRSPRATSDLEETPSPGMPRSCEHHFRCVGN